MWFNLPVNGIAIVPNPSLLRYKYKVVKGTEAVPPAKINDCGNASENFSVCKARKFPRGKLMMLEAETM